MALPSGSFILPRDAGYPQSLFDENEGTLKELDCAICLNVVFQAKSIAPVDEMSDPCPHVFCAPCISAIRKAKCPVCRKRAKVEAETGAAQTVPIGNVRQKVLALAVKCPNREKGCTWTGSLRQYLQQHHESKCDEKLVFACSNGCGARMAGKLHREHHEKECPKEPVVCGIAGCGVKVERAALSRHMSEAAASGQHLMLLQAQLLKMQAAQEAQAQHVCGSHCLDCALMEAKHKLSQNVADESLQRAVRNLEMCQRTDRLRSLWQQACNGDSTAQYNLGYAFDDAEDGLEKDLLYAVRFYQKAAEQGDADAMANLAVMYSEDPELRDGSKEFFYAKMAADLGNATGQNSLAFCYEHGRGTAVNLAEAVRYYQLSAAQHNSSAEFNLAVRYQKGSCGLRKNLPRALKYYQLAQQHGDEDAPALAELLERQHIIAEP